MAYQARHSFVMTMARHCISNLMESLKVSPDDKVVYESLALAMEFNMDASHGIMYMNMSGESMHNGDFFCSFALLGGFSKSGPGRPKTKGSKWATVRFGSAEIWDINEHVNDWYWRNARGANPPGHILYQQALSWSVFNPREWCTGDLDNPGVIEAIWEMWTSFVTSFTMSHSYKYVRETHIVMRPQRYSEWEYLRAEMARLFVPFKAYMTCQIPSRCDDYDLMDVVPSLCR